MAESKNIKLATNTTTHDTQDDEIQRGRSYLAYFDTIPWCSAILNAPDTTILHLLQRDPPLGDTFWRQTLSNPNAIRAGIHAVSSNQASEYPRIKSSISLYSIGPGVFSHTGRCHGGLICTLFDEAMGCLVASIEDAEKQEKGEYTRKLVFTLKSEVSYKKPVPAPGVVLVRCRIDHVEGRKRRVTAMLENEKGDVLCESTAEYLAVQKGTPGGWYAKL